MPAKPRHQDSTLILGALKILLKQQRRSYTELARHLKLSLPSVKRAMNSPDTSLSRIEEICGFLGLTIFDALELARRESVQEFKFSEEQEIFFAANPHFLAYYFDVAENAPAEVEKKYGISRRSTHLYLKKLEQMGLIELHPGDVVKSRVKGGVILWDDHGILGQVFSRAMIKNLSSHAMQALNDPKEMLVELGGWKLSRQEFSDFKRDYKDLCAKFRSISSFNKRAKNQNAPLNISVMIVADDLKDPFQLKVKEIGSVKL